MYWPYPLLVIDRSYVKAHATASHIEIKDPDPEKICALIKSVAMVLYPPEATWYVIPAHPYKSGWAAKKDTE